MDQSALKLCPKSNALSRWVPGRWFDAVENGDKGRDFLIDVAKKLGLLDLRQVGEEGVN